MRVRVVIAIALLLVLLPAFAQTDETKRTMALLNATSTFDSTNQGTEGPGMTESGFSLAKTMRMPGFSLLLILFLGPIAALCQQNVLPDEPSPQASETQQANAKQSGTAKTRSENHIFWVIPNYRSDENQSATTTLAPGAKFKIAIQDSFDPAAFLVAGVFAGMSMAQRQYAPFGQEALGFARYYGGAFADQAIGNIMTESLFPIALHQDPRYFVRERADSGNGPGTRLVARSLLVATVAVRNSTRQRLLVTLRPLAFQTFITPPKTEPSETQ